MNGGWVLGPQFQGNGWDLLGFHYHAWIQVASTPSGAALAGVYGHGSEFWFSMLWPLLMTAVMPVLAIRQFLRQGTRRQRLLAQGVCPCPRCGYSLKGNISGTCPECGIPFVWCCPKCHFEVGADARNCRHCGWELS